MAKTKRMMNPKAQLALQKWRDGLPKDKDGNPIYPKRKGADERLAEKKLKLAKLMKEVEALKAEIAKIDAQVNKSAKAEIVKGYTAEELAEAIKLLKAQK